MRALLPYVLGIIIPSCLLSACFHNDTDQAVAQSGISATAVGDDRIDLNWAALAAEPGAASYAVFRNGEQIATTEATSYSDTPLFANTEFSYQIDVLDSAGQTLSRSQTLTVTTAPFELNDVQIGDPAVSYANVEFTRDGRYMVWFEQSTTGTGLGTVWHCGVNPDTGELVPADGKGFRAFSSTSWGRANPGSDAQGPYYVGMNVSGDLVMVRPTASDAGVVTVLAAPRDTVRRAIYPSDLPDQQKGYVLWIRNEAVPANILDPQNTWFDLRYIDIDDPANEITIERQGRSLFGYPGMDVGFVRWFRDKASLTYGYFDNGVTLQVREYLPASADPGPFDVTFDPSLKVDPFPFVSESQDVMLLGYDAQPTTAVYVRDAGSQFFNLQELITPADTMLVDASLAQSNQPINFDNWHYSAFQINEEGSDFLNTAFAQSGEIWLSTILGSQQLLWRISTVNDMAKAEPEPYVGTNKIWVFYSAAPKGAELLKTTWMLRRAETPIGYR